jgi:type II secretory pathway component PulF
MKIAQQKSYSHYLKKLPFFGFFQIPQNTNRFYNTPARLTFLGGPLQLGAKTCCQNLLEFGKR